MRNPKVFCPDCSHPWLWHDSRGCHTSAAASDGGCNCPTSPHIQAILEKRDGENCITLTNREIWDLIEWECKMGEVTVEDLREKRRTASWPKGKCNRWSIDAEMLLGLVEP